MVVTKREILISVIMGCLMLCFGLFIDSLIVESKIKSDEKYTKALKIDNNNDMFKYALETSVGNAIVYGEFKINKGVTDSWLKNDYAMIEKVTQRYTKHYRTVCTGSDENRTCHQEEYYEWDTIDRNTNSVSTINFSGVEFNYDKFGNYPEYRLGLSGDTVVNKLVSKIKHDYIYEKNSFWNSEGDERYYYKVINKSFYGTVFGNAKNNDLTNESGKLFINSGNVEEFMNTNVNGFNFGRLLFWLFYIPLCGCGIFYYIELENEYLED